MKEFNIGTREFIGVEVPEGANDFAIDGTDNRFGDALFYKAPFMGHEKIRRWKSLPPGNYKIIGLAGELRGRQVTGLLPEIDFMTCSIKELEGWMVELRKFNSLTGNTLIMEKL